MWTWRLPAIASVTSASRAGRAEWSARPLPQVCCSSMVSSSRRGSSQYRGRMLFEQRLWVGLADGTVTVTFRRWRRPRARAGARHRTPAGVLAIDAVTEVDPGDLTEADARAAGFGSLAELRRQLEGRGDGPVYRVDFHHAGADPRE